MSSKFLEQHSKVLAEFARETEERARSNPDEFWLQAAAENQRDAVGKVGREIVRARAEEAGELIDLRLLGPRADGSISLDAFIKIMEPLSRAWKAAAQRLRYGQDDSRIPGAIADQLNLKLSGLSYGSTRVYVTGNGTPDLTGESLLQATLSHTFGLLTASQSDFYDAVDAVGGKAANSLAEAAKAIDSAGFSAELTWHSPAGRLQWLGRHDEIVRFRSWVETIAEPEEYEEEIRGVVAAIKDTGKIDLRTDDGKVIVRYPLSLTSEVQRLAISTPTRLSVRTSKYWDGISKKDVYKRHLLGVL